VDNLKKINYFLYFFNHKIIKLAQILKDLYYQQSPVKNGGESRSL